MRIKKVKIIFKNALFGVIPSIETSSPCKANSTNKHLFIKEPTNPDINTDINIGTIMLNFSTLVNFNKIAVIEEINEALINNLGNALTLDTNITLNNLKYSVLYI